MSAESIVLPHRILFTLHDDDLLFTVTDTSGPAIKRAIAIAKLLEIAAEVDGGSCIDGELLGCACQSISLELEDSLAFIENYDKKRRKKQEDAQGGTE